MKTCEKAVEVDQWVPQIAPNHLKMQGMCEKAVEVDPSSLQVVPDHLKTQEMCDD